MVRDIEIDDKMVNTMLLLWEADVETLYCCQGTSWRSSEGLRSTAYIAFKTTDSAMLFDDLMGSSAYTDWEWTPKNGMICLRIHNFNAFVMEVAYEFSKR